MFQALEYFHKSETLTFLLLVIVFILSRYLLHGDIMKKEHKNKHPSKEVFFYVWLALLVVLHFFAAFWEFDFLSQITTFSISLFILTIISLFIQRQILVIYGEEVEVSGQKYFKKWYTASLFSLFANVVSILIAIFLSIEIFKLDSLIQIGWLWA